MNTDTEPIKCSKCHTPKDPSEFHRRGRRHQNICKECRCKQSREAYSDHGKSRTSPAAKIDPANFQELEPRITNMAPRLKAIAACMAHDPLDADDIYSEMVAGILTKCKPSNSNAYLIQCARWKARAHVERRLTALVYTDDLDTITDEYPGLERVTRATEDQVIELEGIEQFRAVINSLPEKHQRIIAQISVGMSQREIAKQMQVSDQTIYEHVKNLRAQISSSLLAVGTYATA